MNENYISIEGPLARYLMHNFGETWEEKALDAVRSRTMLRRSDYTIRYTKGLVHGNFEISSGIRWHKGNLVISCSLSKSIISSLKGRKISDVIDHPFIDRSSIIIGVDEKIRTIISLNDDNTVSKFDEKSVTINIKDIIKIEY